MIIHYTLARNFDFIKSGNFERDVRVFMSIQYNASYLIEIGLSDNGFVYLLTKLFTGKIIVIRKDIVVLS